MDTAKAAKIISHQGAGKYTVEIQYDDTPRTGRIEEIDQQLTDESFLTALWDAKHYYEDARDQVIAIVDNLTTYIEDLNAALEENDKQWIQEAEQALQQQVAEANKYRNQRQVYRELYERQLAIKTALQQERVDLVRVGNEGNAIVDAWCIDLADGQDGRAIYDPGEFTALYCLNYRAEDGYYLLPPKNMAVEMTPQGFYNTLPRYGRLAAGGCGFWNAAMEPGFAKWEPILLEGKLVITGDYVPCTELGDRKFYVQFENKKSRFGGELILGKYEVSLADLIYFAGIDVFGNGDDVCCLISDITKEGKPAFKVVGFTHDPKGETNFFSLTYLGGTNGFIEGPTPQCVRKGENGQTVSAQGNEIDLTHTYAFSSWSDSSTENPRTDLAVMQAITVTANYSVMTWPEWVDVQLFFDSAGYTGANTTYIAANVVYDQNYALGVGDYTYTGIISACAPYLPIENVYGGTAMHGARWYIGISTNLGYDGNNYYIDDYSPGDDVLNNYDSIVNDGPGVSAVYGGVGTWREASADKGYKVINPTASSNYQTTLQVTWGAMTSINLACSGSEFRIESSGVAEQRTYYGAADIVAEMFSVSGIGNTILLTHKQNGQKRTYIEDGITFSAGESLVSKRYVPYGY